MSMFGTDPGIQLMNPSVIQVTHKADFHEISGIFSCCGGDPTRRYLYVLENSYEQNYPVAADLFFINIPPNCLCPGMDRIHKFYFDRGIFDQQNCCWKIGYYNGAPSTFANNVKYVCLCTDCCDCYNDYQACYCPSACGDRVRYLPADYHCWCCTNKSMWCHNCCGLCGIKTGEPLILFDLANCLKVGTADDLVAAFNRSREEWRKRTGKA